MANSFKINCPTCGQEISANVPDADLINQTRYSMLAVPHEKPIRCKCGQTFVLMISNFQLLWAMQPITEQAAAKLDDSPIIIASVIS